MAVVPTDEVGTVQQEPIAGRAIPRFDDSASPAEFGAGVGEGLEQAASHVQQMQDRADRSAVMALNTQATNTKNQLLFDPQNGAFGKLGANAINLPGSYEPQFDEAMQKIGQGAANPRQQQAFQQHAADERNQFSLLLNRHEYEQQQIAQDEIYKNAIASQAKNAELNYNSPSIVQQSKHAIAMLTDDYVGRKGLSKDPVTGEPTGYSTNIATDLFSKIDGNVGRSLVDRDPIGSMHKLMQEGGDDPIFGDIKPGPLKDELIQRAKVGAAGKWSDGVMWAYRTLGQAEGAKNEATIQNMDEPQDVKDMTIAEIQRKRAQLSGQMQQQNADGLEEVHRQIANGTGDENTIQQIKGYVRDNTIQAAQAGTMIGGIEAQMMAGAEDQAGKDWANDRFNRGVAVDPSDGPSKKYMNAAFQDMVKGVEPLSDQYVNTASLVMSRTGILPKTAMDNARAQYIGGDPEIAGKAALAMRRWETENAHAVSFEMDEKTKAAFDVTADALQGGVPAAVAIQRGRDLANMPKDTRDRLEESWTALGHNTGQRASLSALSSALEADSRFATGTFTAAATIPEDLKGAYERNTRSAYLDNGGNLASAQNTAISDIKHKWGVTYVNGAAQVMEFAPEAMDPRLTTDAIKEAMVNKAVGVTQAPIPTTGMLGQPTAPNNFNYGQAPGMTAQGNLAPYDRPVLKNPDGSYSTTSSIGVGTDKGEVVIPTVVDGKRLSDADAAAHYRKTGQNFGTFSDADSANTFATNLHNAQAADAEGKNPSLGHPNIIGPYDKRAFGSKPMSFPNDDGTETVIPTVVDGKQLSRLDAVKAYQKTGIGFGTFDNVTHAKGYMDAIAASHSKLANKMPFDPDAVQLVPAPGLTEYSQGQKWHLGVKDEFGSPVILTDSSNRPVEFRLPNGTETAAAEQKKMGDAGMKRMHDRIQRERNRGPEYSAAMAATP